jgi:hypothetical protein
MGAYTIGFFSVATAMWGAKEHLGVKRPDSYSYALDTVYGCEVIDDARTVLD